MPAHPGTFLGMFWGSAKGVLWDKKLLWDETISAASPQTPDGCPDPCVARSSEGHQETTPFPLSDGLLLQNEPVVGSTPCLRYIYRYYQKLLDGTTKQNELSLGTYGKGGGRLTKAQALQKVRKFKDWRQGVGLHAHHQDWLHQIRPQPSVAGMSLKEAYDSWMSSSKQKKSVST